MSPRNKRGNIKLRHDQTVSALEKALSHMTEMHTMFLKPHPDYAAGYANICLMLCQVIEFVKKMKEFI